MSKNQVLTRQQAQLEQDINRIRARFDRAAANSSAALDAAYEEAMRYLNAKYHTHPSEIPDWAHTPQPDIDAEIRELNAYASHIKPKPGGTPGLDVY